MILAPLVESRKGEYQQVFDDVRKAGFVRVRVNGEVRDVDDEIKLDRYKQAHHRGRGRPAGRARAERDRPRTGSPTRAAIADSVEQALKLGDGHGGHRVPARTATERPLYSEQFACVYCDISLGEIEPRTFSFNSPHGACPDCTGLGTRLEVDPGPGDPEPRAVAGARARSCPGARPASNGNVYYRALLESLAQALRLLAARRRSAS